MSMAPPIPDDAYIAYTQRFFRRWRRFYDLLAWPIAHAYRKTVRQLDPGPGRSILDICTGTGQIALRCAARGATVVGIDISNDMLACARRKAAGFSVEFRRMDARHLEFPDGHFDGVVLSFALHDMPRKVRLAVLREACRVTDKRVVILDYELLDRPKIGSLMKSGIAIYEAVWFPGFAAEGVDPLLAELGLVPRIRVRAFPCFAVWVVDLGRLRGAGSGATEPVVEARQRLVETVGDHELHRPTHVGRPGGADLDRSSIDDLHLTLDGCDVDHPDAERGLVAIGDELDQEFLTPVRAVVAGIESREGRELSSFKGGEVGARVGMTGSTGGPGGDLFLSDPIHAATQLGTVEQGLNTDRGAAPNDAQLAVNALGRRQERPTDRLVLSRVEQSCVRNRCREEDRREEAEDRDAAGRAALHGAEHRRSDPAIAPNGGWAGLETLVTWARLVRFSHTVFALPFALCSAALAAGQYGVSVDRFLWILVAMVSARNAAMGFNRLVDRKFDARNPRTAARELPLGTIRPVAVWVFTVGLIGLFVVAAWQLDLLWFAPIALAATLLYSYTKRFTWASHLILGAALALAPIGGWLAIHPQLAWPPVLMAAGVLLWVAGFDVIYACQDLEFDRRSGLHSIPARFGAPRALRLARILHVLAWLALAAVGPSARLHPVCWLGTLAVGALLVIEHRLVRPGDLTRLDRAFFDVNASISVVYAAGTVVALWLAKP